MAQTEVIMLKTPFTTEAWGKKRKKKKKLNTVSLAVRAAVIVLQINGCGEHVCAVPEDLCDVIRCKMLFSWLYN